MFDFQIPPGIRSRVFSVGTSFENEPIPTTASFHLGPPRPFQDPDYLLDRSSKPISSLPFVHPKSNRFGGPGQVSAGVCRKDRDVASDQRSLAHSFTPLISPFQAGQRFQPPSPANRGERLLLRYVAPFLLLRLRGWVQHLTGESEEAFYTLRRHRLSYSPTPGFHQHELGGSKIGRSSLEANSPVGLRRRPPGCFPPSRTGKDWCRPNRVFLRAPRSASDRSSF